MEEWMTSAGLLLMSCAAHFSAEGSSARMLATLTRQEEVCALPFTVIGDPLSTSLVSPFRACPRLRMVPSFRLREGQTLTFVGHSAPWPMPESTYTAA